MVGLTVAPFIPAETSKVFDGVNVTLIRPSTVDPASDKKFDEPHWIYVQHDIVLNHDAKLPADRHELLLYIPGTAPRSTKEPEPGHVAIHASHTFCLVAASLGYHVIAISYPNSLSASSCNNDAEPDAFEKFRMAIIQGGTTPHITVSRVDSIENRLIELLKSLAVDIPRKTGAAI